MSSEPSRTGWDRPPPRLRVRLLGAVEVILDGRRLEAFNSVRLQRFLAMIILRSDRQARSRLAFELWPDSGEGQARTNLRKLIHDLRQSLPDIGDFVEIGNEVVRWKLAGPAEVDVLRFRDALATGDLELAVRLYSGDLLPACYDDWVLSERAELRVEAHAALGSLTREAIDRGNHESALRFAQRALDLDPTDEGAIRLQMEAHLARGDRVAAVRSYHRYAEMLDRELAATPGPAVGAMYERLRSGTPASEERQGKQPEVIAESPFVGRDEELRRLEATWSAAWSGAAHLVLVTGEPGIGKTRLAAELGRNLRAEGHAVASARAYEAAGRPPWGPVVDLLRSDAIRDGIALLDAPWRAELARLMPELHVGEPAQQVSGDLAERYRLFDAVTRGIVAGDSPRLLIIDDLKWCDVETIELVGFVIRSGDAARVLVVGTVRMEEVSADHPLHTLVDSLEHEQAVTTIPLDSLDEIATSTLAARLSAGGAVDPELAARLWSESEGNPLFVIEAVRAGISAEGSKTVLTPTMRTVLRARLDQLPEATRKLAEVAAVIGRSFSVGLIVRATGMAEHELVDHLDELWRRRIIRDQGTTYDFSHDKLRAVALEMVSPARRRQLHRAVAVAIASRFGADIDAVSSQLAAHYDQAGMVEHAIDAYWRAGTTAVGLSALDEAVTMFRRAIALLAELPPSSDRDALELDIRLALGSPLVALEGYGSESAHLLYERALALSHKLRQPAGSAILRGLGLARLQGCRFDDCDELGQALLDHASHGPIARTEGHYLLGVSAFWQGDLAMARRHLDGALRTYDLAHRSEHLAMYAQDPKAVCLVRLAWIHLWSGDPGKADEVARSALELAAEMDHLMTSWYVITYATIVAAESGDLPRLGELLEEAAFLSQRLPMRYLMIVGEALAGLLEVYRGSASGIDRIVRAAAQSRAEGETLHLTYTLLLLARARCRADEFGEGRAATREALAWSDSHDQRYLEAELWTVDGELAYRIGEQQTAEASLRRAVEIAHVQGATWLELRALHSLVSRFPDQITRRRLEALVEGLPSGHGLPAFRAAAELLTQTR